MQKPELPPIDLPPPRPDELIVTDESAAEDLALRTGRDLQKQKTAREIKEIMNDSAMQDHLHLVVVIGLYVVGIAALTMFIVVVWHMVTPFPFLSTDQVDELRKTLLTGATGAVLPGIAKKYLRLEKDRGSNGN